MYAALHINRNRLIFGCHPNFNKTQDSLVLTDESIRTPDSSVHNNADGFINMFTESCVNQGFIFLLLKSYRIQN